MVVVYIKVAVNVNHGFKHKTHEIFCVCAMCMSSKCGDEGLH